MPLIILNILVVCLLITGGVVCTESGVDSTTNNNPGVDPSGPGNGPLHPVIGPLNPGKINPNDHWKWIGKENPVDYPGMPGQEMNPINPDKNGIPKDNREFSDTNPAGGPRNQYEEALIISERNLKNNPNDRNAWNNKGFALNNQERYGEAIKAFDQALTLDPEDKIAQNGRNWARNKMNTKPDIQSPSSTADPKPKELIQEWYNKGHAFEQQNQYKEAIDAYQQVLTLDPENYRAWGQIGVNYASLGKNDKAIEAYNKALEIDPHDLNTQRLRTMAFSELNR
jgi:tetratricopeptide (TPR) repeat protein